MSSSTPSHAATSKRDHHWMARALELAAQGEGRVEPNPMVGCVIVDGEAVVGEGYHARFGGPHAEVHALEQCRGADLSRATAYVTLEPCSHFGKTPPCADALICAGVERVVIADLDPFPQVAGAGRARLEAAGIQVSVGVMAEQARELNAPYLKRLATGRPWIIAKWAMSLDGKIATATGESRWISGPESRRQVHRIRSRVDGVMVGIKTALADDPLLTTRLNAPGDASPPRDPQRTATRIVVDSQGAIPLESRLVQSAGEYPLLIAAGPDVDSSRRTLLERAGAEVWQGRSGNPDQRLAELLEELGSRGMTNILVEGGGTLLSAFDRIDQIDELQIFIAPLLIGGQLAPTPLAGEGNALLVDAHRFAIGHVERLGDDVWTVARRLRQP